MTGAQPPARDPNTDAASFRTALRTPRGPFARWQARVLQGMSAFPVASLAFVLFLIERVDSTVCEDAPSTDRTLALVIALLWSFAWEHVRNVRAKRGTQLVNAALIIAVACGVIDRWLAQCTVPPSDLPIALLALAPLIGATLTRQPILHLRAVLYATVCYAIATLLKWLSMWITLSVTPIPITLRGWFMIIALVVWTDWLGRAAAALAPRASR